MKDYFDLWFMATTYQDNPASIAAAVQHTFERRRQELPVVVPVGLSDSFAGDAAKQRQWQAFLSNVSDCDVSLAEVITLLQKFAMPIFEEARVKSAESAT